MDNQEKPVDSPNDFWNESGLMGLLVPSQQSKEVLPEKEVHSLEDSPVYLVPPPPISIMLPQPLENPTEPEKEAVPSLEESLPLFRPTYNAPAIENLNDPPTVSFESKDTLADFLKGLPVSPPDVSAEALGKPLFLAAKSLKLPIDTSLELPKPKADVLPPYVAVNPPIEEPENDFLPSLATETFFAAPDEEQQCAPPPVSPLDQLRQSKKAIEEDEVPDKKPDFSNAYPSPKTSAPVFVERLVNTSASSYMPLVMIPSNEPSNPSSPTTRLANERTALPSSILLASQSTILPLHAEAEHSYLKDVQGKVARYTGIFFVIICLSYGALYTLRKNVESFIPFNWQTTRLEMTGELQELYENDDIDVGSISEQVSQGKGRFPTKFEDWTYNDWKRCGCAICQKMITQWNVAQVALREKSKDGQVVDDTLNARKQIGGANKVFQDRNFGQGGFGGGMGNAGGSAFETNGSAPGGKVF